MRIKFLRDCHGRHGSYRAGQTADIAESIAQAWCASRAARPASEPESPKEEATPVETSKAPQSETAAVDKGERATLPKGLRRKVD